MDLNLITSNFHIEMNPSDVGIYDRIVVQDVIKDIAQTQQIDSNASRNFKGTDLSYCFLPPPPPPLIHFPPSSAVVVIHEADFLSRDAQAGLRRTMEKYMKNLRIVLVCNSCSKVIPPIRSRCLLIRIPAPSHEDISKILLKIGRKEGIQVPERFAQKVSVASDRNLRKAILLFEASKVQKYPFEDDQEVTPIDWQEFVRDLAAYIVKEQTPKALIEVRAKLYELTVHCIPATDIIKQLVFHMNQRLDPTMKGIVVEIAAQYEHRIQLGTKPIFHLEAFVAQFMSLNKQYLIALME